MVVLGKVVVFVGVWIVVAALGALSLWFRKALWTPKGEAYPKLSRLEWGFVAGLSILGLAYTLARFEW